MLLPRKPSQVDTLTRDGGTIQSPSENTEQVAPKPREMHRSKSRPAA